MLKSTLTEMTEMINNAVRMIEEAEGSLVQVPELVEEMDEATASVIHNMLPDGHARAYVFIRLTDFDQDGPICKVCLMSEETFIDLFEKGEDELLTIIGSRASLPREKHQAHTFLQARKRTGLRMNGRRPDVTDEHRCREPKQKQKVTAKKTMPHNGIPVKKKTTARKAPVKKTTTRRRVSKKTS